jgi:outer membrane biosynthesis protein TonB
MMRSSKEQAGSNSLIVRVFWGDILYDTVLCEQKESITVGREPGCTFVMDLGKGSTIAKLPLVTIQPDGSAEISFDGKMEGHVRGGGKLQTLEKLRALPETTKSPEGLFKVRLTQQDTASIVVGYVSFDITWSKGRSLMPRTLVLDTRAAAVTGAIALSMLVLFTIFTVPEVETPEEEKPPERVVEIVPPKVLRPKPIAPTEASPPPAAGAPAPAPAPTTAQVPQPAAPKAPTAAETLKSADLGSLVSNLSAIGANVAAPTVAKRDVANDTPSQSFSANAVAATGPAKASIGKTQGAGEGGFAGTGQLGLAGNSGLAGGTGTVLGAPGGEGGAGLDRQVIDQIVRRRQDRIRLCYERQLNFVPGLAGKVTVQFLIDGSGNVMKSTIIEDTMKNKAVNDCLASEVKSWTFPKPKGGATVKVDYPFVFESGGTNF